MPTEVLYGPRLGGEGELRLGCCAVLFDESREKVFLTKRADNGRWCLPGGGMEAGESAAEACVREFFEETGLTVEVIRLIGVYSNPDQLVIYPDGKKVFMVVLSFEVRAVAGKPGLSNETTSFGYFSPFEMTSLPMHDRHQDRVKDAIRGGAAVIK